jgi:hypothetical protein
MSKFKFDIIEDTDGTLFYEVEDKPETRQGPFTAFSELFNHLKTNMNIKLGFINMTSEAFKKEDVKNDMQRVQPETGNEGRNMDVSTDKEDHLLGAPMCKPKRLKN